MDWLGDTRPSMGISVAAILHCPDAKVRAHLQVLKDAHQVVAYDATTPATPEELLFGLKAQFMVIRVGFDCAIIVGLTRRYDEFRHEKLTAQVFANQVVSALPPGCHVDSRGLLLFPDVVETDLTRYHELIDFLEKQGGLWASVAPIDESTLVRWKRNQTSPVRFLFRMVKQALF
jgi:hypothetical protein